MIFEFNKVCKSFKSFHVVKDMSFSIESGKTTYFIGRSGEGKSISLKMMVGLLRPTSGQILYRGRNFLEFSATQLAIYRKSVGFLFQHSALFDSMSVFENIVFAKKEHDRNLWKFDLKDLKKEATQILEVIGLRDALDVMPGDLSVGEKKRVALGRALITKPQILFYDEPTTGLDPIYASRIDELIAQTKQAYPNLTSVVVSHDAHAALKYADCIVMLKHGTAYKQDSPRGFEESTDPYIKQFLGGYWF